MDQENPKPEATAKKNLWRELEDRLNTYRIVGLLSDEQVYRLLTDFAQSHKPIL